MQVGRIDLPGLAHGRVDDGVFGAAISVDPAT